MSGEHDGLVIAPPAPRSGCSYLAWKDVAGTDDPPEMRIFCRKLQQFLPQRKRDRDMGLCAKCILYEPKGEQ